MRARLAPPAVLVAVAAIAVLAVPSPALAAGQAMYSFQDSRIDEASGIAAGVTSPGIDYVQNDSGDVNRFFAIASDGSTAATVTVPNATNVDWEDIATGPSSAHVPSVWLADIGDNGARRSEVDVYRVAEPSVAGSARGRTITTAVPDKWRLSYPSGPVNAESFATRPNGTGYIVTKSPTGDSVVYRLPATPDRTKIQPLLQVGTIDFNAIRSPSAGNDKGTLLATAADISKDDKSLVVRTYHDAYLWHLTTSISAALRTAPTRITLPPQPQGEGIAFDGSSLITDSEDAGSTVYRVSLPAGFVQHARPHLAVPTLRASNTAMTTPTGAPTPGAPSAWWAVAVVGMLGLAASTLYRRHGTRRPPA